MMWTRNSAGTPGSWGLLRIALVQPGRPPDSPVGVGLSLRSWSRRPQGFRPSRLEIRRLCSGIFGIATAGHWCTLVLQLPHDTLAMRQKVSMATQTI